MNLPELAIRRPTFISCIVLFMLVIGFVSLKKMPVDMFPDVTFPIVSVYVRYPGASPVDMEKQVSKIIEDELSSLSGLETLSSNNYDSASVILLKFKLGIDIKDAEQQVRNRVGNVRSQLPDDIIEPVIRRFDPADQPIMYLAVTSPMEQGELYGVVDQTVKPVFERIQDVGQVTIFGGRKKEIHVLVDKDKLQDRQLSMISIAQRIEQTSKDVPIGKVDNPKTEVTLRTAGEFTSLKELEDVSVNFLGSDRSVKLKEVADVVMTLEEPTRLSTINGQTALTIAVYKQSGANTVAVADGVAASIAKVNTILKERKIDAEVRLVRDGSVPIRLNVSDVRESILIGIILCILVVFFFLGSARSTFITGMALPNSLLGAFVIMVAMGFSINIMTLLALSLAVGLLIDDAIVVRENIFRHMEMGKDPKTAALEGTGEVSMAVIATTLVVIAVFGPISFVPGIVGQFFKQFGLTVVFAMIISLFDAFTVAPMLSAYMAAPGGHGAGRGNGPIARLLNAFDRVQSKLEDFYESALRWTLGNRKKVLLAAAMFFVLSIVALGGVAKTFLPANELGEFSVTIELPTGTSLEGTDAYSKKVEETIRSSFPEVDLMLRNVGNDRFEANKSDIYVHLVARDKRKFTSTEMKTRVREKLAEEYKDSLISVSDIDISGGGQKPLNLYIVGDNLDIVSDYALKVRERVSKIPGLVDVDTNFRAGKPEYHVVFDRPKSESLGVSTATAGLELRYRTEGAEAAIYRKNGIEYKIRAKFAEKDKDLRREFNSTLVPNANFNMIPLSRVAKGEDTTGYSQVNRQNKGRFIAITANLGPKGNLGNATDEIERVLKTELKPPVGVEYRFEGQAQDFKDLIANMLIAAGLGILFIYLVLASLYESFITPFTILLAIPLAISGAIMGLFIFGKTFDIFSIIGMIMLMGVVAKNSILLVDYTQQLLEQGLSQAEALVKSGRTRLRPILMTSLALIAGTLPIALGLTELGSQRMSMGIAIISGVTSSTLLTLLVVPAAYGYVDAVRVWSRHFFAGKTQQNTAHGGGQAQPAAKHE